MAVTGITSKPEVVRYGGAREERFAYVDGEAFEAGDLIRLTTAGEIKLAEVDSSGAGAVSGMALEAVASEVNETVAVLMFAEDTVVAIQCVDTVAPEDLAKGQTYILEYSAGTWGIPNTTTNGVATIQDFAATGQPWADVTGTYGTSGYTGGNPITNETEDNGKVLVSFAQAILDGHAA